ANEHRDRLGVFSFWVEGIHHNLMVKLLNDHYGVQVRGGCSCAGTYGHFMLKVDKNKSQSITDKINSGNLEDKPGWVRLSIHPTMTDAELKLILKGIREIIQNIDKWQKDYHFDKEAGEFFHVDIPRQKSEDFDEWFRL
ncbi:MAG: aminotransferase class V-fold PLP-dependent enzyme, partial [Bacteroidota bacterium]|nr:aminotransferase class V-fold PLP-dependent enzyme [Bacteroidota bacterium]